MTLKYSEARAKILVTDKDGEPVTERITYIGEAIEAIMTAAMTDCDIKADQSMIITIEKNEDRDWADGEPCHGGDHGRKCKHCQQCPEEDL